MKRIFKYQLQTTDEQTVSMPRGAAVICVDVQAGIPCLWAMVDDAKPMDGRSIRTIGTGHPIHDAQRLDYLGTYQLHGGGLVFHVFERGAE